MRIPTCLIPIVLLLPMIGCQSSTMTEPVQGKTKLFSGEAEGLSVQLPEWVYPLVCDTTRGTLRYDNFSGRWGDSRHLDRFLQAYACERAKAEARRRGHQCTEAQLPGGSIKLTIQVQGGAT